MIVDAHAHLGTCRVFDLEITAGELIRAMDQNGVNTALVFPLPGAPDARAVHDEIADLAKREPGRIFGVASLNPHADDQAYFDEVERCVSVLGFVGLKLHPLGHACSPTSRDATKVFDTARALDIPLIVHTGTGAPFALPSMVVPRARQYPDVNIVLAHAGGYIYSGEALVAAAVCPNIYLETSTCSPHRIREMAMALDPGRVLFGADLPGNIGAELAKYRTCGLSDELQSLCLGRAAQVLFGLSGYVEFREGFAGKTVAESDLL